MILFDNKSKIKWEQDKYIESKWKKNSEIQFSITQILKNKVEKNLREELIVSLRTQLWKAMLSHQTT